MFVILFSNNHITVESRGALVLPRCKCKYSNYSEVAGVNSLACNQTSNIPFFVGIISDWIVNHLKHLV